MNPLDNAKQVLDEPQNINETEKEINIVAHPHGDNVLRRIFGDVFDLFRGKIKNPDIVSHAAAIPFPGAKLPENPVISHLFIVRRK